ncbi:hypothetical protein NH340_JMT04428 [Sarcoptes scabiei]|nr:hypothetical protein NH340_JMT04428 [Sarcoptes scabiei]
MTTFDPYDQNSWFFGALTRNQAIELLELEKDKGIFLVRYSHSVAGDLVLSVSEENKISHYIINKIDVNGEPRFKIGENTFHDMPSLLTYYKHHYLDTTALIRAAKKNPEYVRAKFDFLGKDKEDLPFKKNEILTIISKDEDQWWKARNEKGETGSIPVPYVELIDEEEYLNYKNEFSNANLIEETNGPLLNESMPNDLKNHGPSRTTGNSLGDDLKDEKNSITSNSDNNVTNCNSKKIASNLNRKLPAKAIVIQQRIPNAYDKKALKLEKGDIITVTNTNLNGQWDGELKGKKGHFPFNYIRFLDEE